MTGAPGILNVMSGFVQRAAESVTPVDPNGLPGGAARDFAQFLSIYQELLGESGLIERAQAHRSAAGRLHLMVLPDVIAIDGFTSYTSAQESFMAAAAARCEVYATLVFDPSVPATYAAEPTARRLANVGAVEAMSPSPEGTGPAELHRIDRSFGVVGGSDVAASGAVVISQAWGLESEAARIAREVQDACSLGIPAGETAVVFRDVVRHLAPLRAAFSETGIAYEVDAMLPFAQTPFGRALLLLLRIDSAEHPELIDLLASPYGPTSHADLDRFDAHVRSGRGRPRAVAGALSWFREHDAATASFLRRACRLGKPSPPTETARAMYLTSSQMLAWAHSGGRHEGMDLLLDAAVQRAFIDAVDALAAVGQALNSATLYDVLRETSVALASSESPECVQVMGAERVRGRRYECVIVGGLNEGGFPRRTHEDVLTDPAVQQAFQTLGLDLAPRSGIAEERLLFYQVITRARKRLVLSTQTHDADGRRLRGSVFVEEVLDLYRDPSSREYFNGEPPVKELGLDGLAEHEHAPRSERRTLRSIAAADGGGKGVRWGETLRRARRGTPALSEAARRHAGNREAFSASEIETYLQCPFRWCVQHLVQPRELDDALDAAAAGRLGHHIMRRFYEVFPERTGSPRVTPDLLKQAAEVHAEVAAACLTQVRAETAAEAIACRAIVRRTLQVIEDDADLLPGFAPLWHEWSFGFGDGDEPEDLGGFSLVGRVDRLDSDGRRVVLTDYKSGSIGAEHGAARLGDEGLVQLPLYLVVVSRRMGLEPAAGVYRSFKGGKPRGLVGEGVACKRFVSTDTATGEEVAAHLEAGVERASAAVRRMQQGDISPTPLSGNCPGYCPARSFCSGWRPGRG